jgi:transposase InsO family protein
LSNETGPDQTIQVELLGSFDSLDAAQAAVDTWRMEYNTHRPHQALDMATAKRFTPSLPRSALSLGYGCLRSWPH